LCGVKTEWSAEQAEQAIASGTVPHHYCEEGSGKLEQIIRAIKAGVEPPETVPYARRAAAVLWKVTIDGYTALQIAVFNKYGGWNVVWLVSVDGLVKSGEPVLEEVWRQPTPAEMRLAELRREAQNYVSQVESARISVEAGLMYLLSFVRGRNPKTNKEQWEATGEVVERGEYNAESGEYQTRRVKAKFVLDGRSPIVPAKGKSYYCYEQRRLVDQPSFKLVIVEISLEAERDFAAEIAAAEAAVAAEKAEAERKAAEGNKTAVDNPLAALSAKWGARIR
jgi:hypothetical protein